MTTENTVLSDIITFLQARYAEHEEIITDYLDSYDQGDKWRGWKVRGEELVTNYGKIIIEGECADCGSDASIPKTEFLAMIAASDPWKVLADLESKRWVLAELSDHGSWSIAQMTTALNVLSALALPFAEHPDYQQEWKM